MINKTSTFKLAFLLLFCLGFSNFYSQSKPKQFKIPQKKGFPSDSLFGFDEQLLSNDAISKGLLAIEIPVYISRLKREFLNKKYNLKESPSEWPAHSFKPIGNGGQNQIMTPACNNEDFEFGNITGWTDSQGMNMNSQTMAGCCPTAGASTLMCPSTAFDPATNLSLASPFGGNWVVRLGDLCSPGEVHRLSKTFTVSATNALFQVAYFAVLENAAGHPCNATPYVNINMLNCANVPLACPSVSVVAPSSSCMSPITGFTTGTYPSGGVPQTTSTYSSYAVTTVTVPGSGYTSYYGYYYYSPGYTYTTSVGVGTPTTVISTYTSSTATYSAVNTVTVPGGTSYYGYYYAPYTYTVGVGTPTYVVTTYTAYCQSSGSWSGWKVASLDLTQYIGTCVTIQLTVGGCSYGGHNGYAYFDTQCSAVDLTVNNSLYPAGSTAFSVSVCGSTSGTVTAPPGLGPYTWNGPPGSGITSYTNQTFTTTTNGNYVLSMNPPGACAPITKTVTLQFIPPPSASFTTNNICTTFTITNTSLPSPAIQTYSFAGVGAPATFTTTNPTSVVSFPSSGNFTITQIIDSGGGCIATTSSIISVPSGPTAIFSVSNPTQCIVGNSFNFSAQTPSGIHSYSFSPAIGAPPVGNIANYSGSFTSIGTYSVTHNYTVTSTGCTSNSTTVVSINPMPIVNASSSGNVCQNWPVTLSANGANSYVWSGPSGFSSSQGTVVTTNAPFNFNGTFTVTGIDAFGCSGTATVAQVIFAAPTPVAVGSSGCVNDNLTLNVSAGSSYLWSGPSGFSSTLQNPTLNNVTFNNSGLYTVVVSSANGCTASAVANCNVYTGPNIGYLGNTSVCNGGVFTFSGTGGLNYKWLAMSGVLSLADSYSISSVSPNFQPTYTLVGADANGCLNTVVITPLVLPLPNAYVAPQKDAGCAPLCTSFDLTNQSSNITSIAWHFSNGNSFNDSTKVTQCFNSAGTQTVTINLTDINGCKSAIQNSITVYPIPTADFIYSPDAPNENDFTVTFQDVTQNASISNWHWDFYSNGTDTSAKRNPTYDFPNIGNYFVYLKVTSNYGCVDSIVKKLSVEEDVTFFVPNSFSPNGDNNNELFMPKGVGVKKYHMDIFDRWGQLIYSTNDIEKGWDGKSKKGGDVLAQDTYVYKITVTQSTGKPKQYVGHITLIK